MYNGCFKQRRYPGRGATGYAVSPGWACLALAQHFFILPPLLPFEKEIYISCYCAVKECNLPLVLPEVTVKRSP